MGKIRKLTTQEKKERARIHEEIDAVMGDKGLNDLKKKLDKIMPVNGER